MYTLNVADPREEINSDHSLIGILGFLPITDVGTGILTGSLNFGRYSHELELTTKNDCVMRITDEHHLEIEGGELVLKPGTGIISSPNCTMSGRIDFVTLRRL